MKQVLITGAGGVLGRAILDHLRHFSQIEVAALDIHKGDLPTRYPEITAFDLNDFQHGKINFENLDAIIHCAFTRSQNGGALASSIDFTKKIFDLAVHHNISKVINISSQSIYGGYREHASSEEDPVDPVDAYAVAKYACEKLSNAIFSDSACLVTNVRMASLIGVRYPERIVYKMSKYALQTGKIKIVGGSQLFSFLHLQDAVAGLMSILNSSIKKWDSVYNLGTSEQYDIHTLAQTIAEVIREKTGKTIEIEVEISDVKHAIPLDVAKIKRDFNWEAKISLREAVCETIDYLLAQEEL